MNCVRRAYEEIAGSGNHQRTGPAQQSFVDRYEIPQSGFYVLGKAHGKCLRIADRQLTFTHVAVKDCVEFGEGPERRMDNICFANKLANFT